MKVIEPSYDATFNALAESLRLLRSLGYPIEQTAWDVSDLPIGLQRKIHHMHLLSTINKGFEHFSVFLIELQHNENYLSAHQDGRSVLDSFLRRYPQGQYLFIIAIIGQRKLILGHPQGISWRQGMPSQKFSFWSIKPAHLRKLDRWLIRGLSIKSHDTPTSIANKHRLAFKEAKQRRAILRQKKVGDFPLVLQAFLADVSRYPIPNQQQREEYALRASQGDKVAYEQLIHANLRMVYSEARKYQGLGVDLMDLIQEGMAGLMRAVPKFDPSLGNQFSTYAMWWIRQGITRTIANDSSAIRLPVHLYDEIAKILDAEHTLRQVLGRTPTNYELALESDRFSDDEKMEAWFAWITENTWLNGSLKDRIAKLTIKIERARSVAQGVLPLEIAIPTETALYFGLSNEEIIQKPTLTDLLPSVDDELDTQFDRNWLSDMVAWGLAHLDERPKSIIERRFGFLKGDEETLEEIGINFDVTRERIRQIEKTSLEKLARVFRHHGLERWWNEQAEDTKQYGFENIEKLEIQKMSHSLRSEIEGKIWKSQLEEWKRLPIEKRWEKIRQAIPAISDEYMQIPNIENFIMNYVVPEYLRRFDIRKFKLGISKDVESEDQDNL